MTWKLALDVDPISTRSNQKPRPCVAPMGPMTTEAASSVLVRILLLQPPVNSDESPITGGAYLGYSDSTKYAVRVLDSTVRYRTGTCARRAGPATCFVYREVCGGKPGVTAWKGVQSFPPTRRSSTAFAVLLSHTSNCDDLSHTACLGS